MVIKLIVLNGLGGNGKSSFATYCKNYVELNYSNIRVEELSSVDIVKVAARAVGWNGGKSTKDRQFLSDLKFCMEKWCNLPIRSIFDKIQELTSKNKDFDWIFFINSREAVDHDKIYALAKENNLPIMKIIVTNPNAPITEVPELVNDILSIKYDEEIVNDGTLLDLSKKADEFIDRIIGGDK